MSRKKIKVKYETFYRLSHAACEALGIDYDESRAATMQELLQANKTLEERAASCKEEKGEGDQ